MMSVAPTLSAAVADESLWDVAIIGAGPAGALAACLLARQGRHVLLVDRSSFPRDKTCGCCLNPVGAKLLRDLELSPILADATRLDRLLLRLPSRTLDVRLPPSLALPRSIFDTRLVQAAIAQGASFLPATVASLHEHESSSQVLNLTLRCGETVFTIRTRAVLAADGLKGSTLDVYPQCAWRIAPRSWFGVSCTVARPLSDFPAGAIAMHVAQHGYVGAIRLPDGQTHFAAALDPAACRASGGPTALLNEILSACHLAVIPDLDHATLSGTPLLTRYRPCLGAHRVLAIGDAAAYIEPFSGEGMTWALQSAHLLTNLLPASLEQWPTDLPMRWTKCHHKLLASHYRTCHLMRFLLHRPRLLGSAAFLAQAIPLLGRMLVHRVTSAAQPVYSGVGA